MDEVEESGPKVPLVISPAAFTCRAERLARAGAGPDGAVVGPSGAAEGMGPDADPGEEVALRESVEVIGRNILDRAGINLAGRDLAGGDQRAQPFGGAGVILIVVGSGMEPQGGGK